MFCYVLTLVAIAVCPWPARGLHGGFAGENPLDWPGYNIWPPGTTFQQQLVGGYHPYWYQQQVPTVVPRIVYKTQDTNVQTYVYVPKQVTEVQRRTAYVPVARVVEEEVPTTVLLPFVFTGPDGKPIISCRPEVKTHKVQRVVHDMKPVTREYEVKVTRMVPEARVTTYKQVVPVVVYDQQMTAQWQYTLVPYERLQTVPVFDPHHAPKLFWP